MLNKKCRDGCRDGWMDGVTGSTWLYLALVGGSRIDCNMPSSKCLGSLEMSPAQPDSLVHFVQHCSTNFSSISQHTPHHLTTWISNLKLPWICLSWTFLKLSSTESNFRNLLVEFSKQSTSTPIYAKQKFPKPLDS